MSATIHRLSAYGYEVAVDVENGASLISLTWLKPEGERFEILHPCPPATPARDGGCFIMAPFANRIDGGRFEFDGRTIQLPINRPDDGLAIHGFSRDRKWDVLAGNGSSLQLRDRYDGGGSIPFAYSLVQTITLDQGGVELSLELTNLASATLPYGFGFHPWFRKEPRTYLSFDAETAFARGERGFPERPAPHMRQQGFSEGVDLSAMPWFDRHFAGWQSRSATVEWRSNDVRMTLSSTGALRNLHLYVPDDRPVFCVEPVSHVPDVVNRRPLASFGDATELRQGEKMTGSMRLSLSGILR